MKLLTNNKVPPAPDTEAHQLKNLFRFAHTAGQTDAETLLQYATSLDVPHHKDYNRLVTRGYDFLTFVIATRASTHFDNFMTDSRHIVDVQHYLWGLLAPSFRFMLQQLFYIASDADLPTCDQEQEPEEYTQQLYTAVTSPSPDRYLSKTILDLLVQAADEAFNEHLADEVRLVGTEDKKYLTLFQDYATLVGDRLQELIDAYKLDKPSNWRAQDEAIVDDALGKLHVILVDQAAFEHVDAPALDGPMPLLSTVAASMIIDHWWALRHVLYAVSTTLHCPTIAEAPPSRSATFLCLA